MRLSDDLVEFTSSSSNDEIKLYNKFTNNLVELHIEIYKYLINCNSKGNFDKILNDLSHEQIQYLLDSNILINNEDEYFLKGYVQEKNEIRHKITDAYLHLTFNCNLRCEYCYQRQNLNKCKNLSLERWTYILDELKKQGTERINITGGEPLMYKDVERVILYARQKDFKVTLLTNGMLIDPGSNIYKNIENVIISLDSMNVNLRKGINTKRVMKNIKELKSLNTCKVMVRSVFTHGYEEECIDVKNRVEKLGLKHISAMCMPSKAEEMILVPDYIKYGLVDEECVVSGCGAGDSIVAINPIGDIFPCQILMLPEFKIANIFENDWVKKYKDSNINMIINSFNTYDDKECKECAYHHICSGGCRGNSYLMYGNFDTRPDYLCDYYKNCGRLWFENAK